MRYAGSKKKFMKHLLPIISEHLKDEDTLFVDMCTGGANVVSEVDWHNKWAVDNNEYVIAMWKRIQELNAQGGDAWREWIPSEVSEETYLKAKDTYINSSGGMEPGLVGYILSSCSFGSAWANGYARTNVARGENHILEAYNNICRQVENFKNLQDTTFICCSYDELTFPKNTLIYVDPPYATTKKYMHDFAHQQFYEWCRKMKRKGHTLLISEYDMPYDFKCIWSMEKKDSLGRRKGQRQNIRIEKLFTL